MRPTKLVGLIVLRCWYGQGKYAPSQPSCRPRSSAKVHSRQRSGSTIRYAKVRKEGVEGRCAVPFRSMRFPGFRDFRDCKIWLLLWKATCSTWTRTGPTIAGSTLPGNNRSSRRPLLPSVKHPSLAHSSCFEVSESGAHAAHRRTGRWRWGFLS